MPPFATPQVGPTNVKDAPAFHENPYCKALNNAKDIQFDCADVEGNAKNGPVVRLSFASLFDALGTCLKDESSVLLLYSLVHGNCDFQEYVLVRTDLDSLLMPIFEMLYDASRKTSNQIYMLLITLLILSQDSTFNASVHKLVRKLTRFSLFNEFFHDACHTCLRGSFHLQGGLLIIPQYKFPFAPYLYLQDVYLHTNCLVILAIMGPHAHRLSAYASRRLVSLFDMLPRKYAKLAELKNDNALKVMSDQIEADITSDDMFSSHNSFLSSRVGLGLAVQGSDAWHSKCEEYGFAEGVSTKAPATSDANASTNEDDTKTVSSV
ncbi:dymeclin-like [Triticum aestivum]|uniref:dymeclin-like n=1 Tax=Triticum aestivum TaxID=4565 RepID=UPI001D0247E6|nr:dymeclin-like [Triticum aestivum]